MTLKEWLKEKDLRVSDLSKMLDAKQPTVYTWVNGVKRVGSEPYFPTPDFVWIKKIHKLTKGKVSYNDWGV